MTDLEFETAKLLAHFKVQAKRSGISADLALMLTNETYAAAVFHEVEEASDDEDLIFTMLRLRSKLLKPAEAPAAKSTARPEPASNVVSVTPARQSTPAPSKPKSTPPPTPFMRDYRNGARG